MGLKIKVNDLGLSHKGSNGFVRNTLPDVCKTPSPGGPVPIPYPVILSKSGDLANGTTTVFADGDNMVSIKGSEYSSCNGDEAGTAGGVKSSTNMKEAKWILCSFDVKFDGAGVCRNTDKMTMNHENTVSLAGDFEIEVIAAALKAVAQACDEAVNKKWDADHPKGPKHDGCWKGCGETMWNNKKKRLEPKPVQVKLGNLKEACVQEAAPDTDYRKNQQGFKPDGTPCSADEAKKIQGAIIPDTIVHGPGGVTDVVQIFDLKFPCPSEQHKDGQWSVGQKEKYERILKAPASLIFP
jgi:hypothetical protein